MQNSICILLWIGGLCQTNRNGNRHHEFIHLYDTNIERTREKKAGNWEIMQFVGRLFNTQRASVVVMRS